ncbi:myotubularin-related protein 14 isoform X2 [Episyrphus balteatus]|uniref:myotubularin-related protein 14 isoform X2 n=1 Tax=Episyrphus balteatus TaxID=286459 RepID=UPI0024853A9D|nr:myotubularin-related protein 14 isoform X2 [Episyrphus balteatus]
MEHDITKKCESLFKADYSLIELDNSNGALCPRYPSRIFIPEFEASHSNMPSTSSGITNGFSKPIINGLANGIQAYVTFANTSSSLPQQTQKTIYEDLYDAAKIRELITMAKYARCRQRFTVPVIMYKGKYICRSATISVMPETYGRKVVDYAYDCLNGGGASTSTGIVNNNSSSSGSSSATNSTTEDDNNDPTDESLVNQATEPLPFSYDEVIKSDIQLLRALNVSTIVDLMVEQRKVKYFMTVSSSEKADPENHYEQFNILSLPYPGCEFFKKFRDNNYMAKNLFFNWKQSFIDASLSIPINGPAHDIDINWQEYKKWDLVLITQNYLKATLKCIQEETSGVLIHCISGWDRTPLFVSLVRLSLWADGLIHQSLSPLQMTYFTVAYDWYLFGHQLPDRLKRSEDIMFFCFHVLKYILDDDFSATEPSTNVRRRTKTTSSSGSSVVVVRSDGGDEDTPKDQTDSLSQADSLSQGDCLNQTDMTILSLIVFIIVCRMYLPRFLAKTQTTDTNNLDFTFEDSNDSNSNPSNCDMLVADSVSNVNNSCNPSNASNTSSSSSMSIGSNTSTVNNANSPPSNTNNNPNNTANSPSNNLTSRSPNPKRIRTSPISVPGSNANRQRQESTSSVGSWQIVTEAGSLDSSTNSSYISQQDAPNGPSTSNAATDPKVTLTPRKQRLNAVRAIFIQSYGKTIGLKFKEGSSMNLTSFIGTLADQLFT